MAAKFCDVCGSSSGIYPLCPKCFKLRDEGKVIKCDKCGKWHYSNVACSCTAPKVTINDNSNDIIINNDNKYRCIICGDKTDGVLFCKSCYFKYKDKILLLRVSNCSNITLLDDSYEGKYTCNDGHIVKSKSEAFIDNYLYEHNIKHAYEKSFPYGPNPEDILHPDFYLPNYLGIGNDVYIEHWGYDNTNKEYTASKQFKLDIYRKNKTTLICTYETIDTNDINSSLERKLNKNFIKANCINYEQKS